MAEKTVRVDDLDGTPDATTIPFSIEKYHWEIDLNEKNRRRLYEALEQFIEVARRVELPKTPPAGKGKRKPLPKTDPAQLDAIRKWARANGYRVADRGRPPAAVVAAYEAAHQPQPKQSS